MKVANYAYRMRSVMGPCRWWSLGSILDRWNWFPDNCFGYRRMVGDVWNNIVLVLTPWYRPWRRLLAAFIESNDMKLLCDNRNFAHLRTRGENQYYYTLRKRRLLWAELKETCWIDSRSGDKVNAFGAGISALLSGATEEETEERYREETRIVCRGFILTPGACQRLMDRIVESTKDTIDWYEEEVA